MPTDFPIKTNSYDEQQVQLPCVHNRIPDNNNEATTSHVESRQKEYSSVIYSYVYSEIIITSLLTAIEFSLGGSSPYTSTDKKIRINIHKRNNKKHSTNSTNRSKYKYTYYQNTHTIFETQSHTLTHTLQNKLKQPQYKIHTQ
jgi:hypothetical protein